jgi:hypothetical protein
MVAAVEVGTSLRDAVVAVGEHWSTAQQRLVHLVAELDRSNEWALDGSPTCAHWIAAALDIEVCTAREWLRVGRALTALPKMDGLFDTGQLSYSKVRALTRVAKPENEADLCRLALRVSAGRLPHALASWLARHESPEETETRQRNATALRTWTDPDGMVAMSVRLPPLAGGVVMAAVDTKVTQFRPDASADASERWPSRAQQRADALVGLVAGGGAAIQTEVVLHVRGDGCTLDDGTPIAGSIVERIAPASFLRALIHDAERRPINASGAHRHPTRRQKRVVKERDGVCVGCGSSEFLQYDHDPDFEETRHTLIEELFLRCAKCHRDRHQQQRRD